MPETTFKKVRLFKVSRELNIAVESLVEHLEQSGFGSALSGAGLNASITDEDAYLDLLDEFAEDKEIAARLRRKREEHLKEEGADGIPLEPAVPEPVAAPAAEEPAAPEPVAAEVEAVEPEPVQEAEPDVQPEPELSPEPVAVERDEVEPAPTPEPTPEPESEAKGEPEPVAEEEPEPEKEPVDEVVSEALEVEPEPVDPAAEESEVEEAPAAPVDLTLTADRYKLAGTKILGKMDLSTVEDSDGAGGRRKAKRKRIDKTGGTDQGPDAAGEGDRARGKKARKKARGPAVDEADVEKTLQETLRELEMGASRARQKRRRARRDERALERERETERRREEEGVLRVTEFVSTGELANLMNVGVNEVIGKLFSSGMMVSINQRLDADTITIVADEFGYEVEFISDVTETDIFIEEDDPDDLHPRAPVVTVMGHVDHGKTSLLDYIRKANVVAGEAGGITQHIGAYHVEISDGRFLTFLDTPGHEAFTAMRARGAQVTDLVILVVAADDAVMPQTIEAINHARAAEVPIVVAINKVDKADTNVDRVQQQLADHGVLVEQYGGKVQCAFVSAKTGQGIPDLLEKVVVESEMLNLTANPERNAVCVVIESRLEKGRGTVATVLVQNGTLRVGDAFIAGVYSGRVRAMFDERDRRIDEVGPSKPALVTGLDGAPNVGDTFLVVDDEREAREIAQKRHQIMREQTMRQRKHITLDEIGRRLALGDFQELNLIVKADVGGSVEAVADSLLKLSTEEVAVNIVHKGVGAINESDVMLASASDAIIIGFQVRPQPSARALAEAEEIDIRLYSVIYSAIEEVRDALEGLLSPEKSEHILGVAEVRETFKVPKVGTVAGCLVIEGKIRRNDRVHLIRDGVVIYEGTLSSLRRFKDDVKEVVSGYECGMGIENFNDVKVEDQIEAFEIVEKKRKLEA